MKTRRFSGGLQLMFTPEALVPFLIGSLMLSIAGNAGYQLLTNLLGTSNKAVIAIGISMLLIVAGAAAALSRLIRRLRPLPPLMNKQAPDKRKGLILLVSSEPICRKAIAWHGGTLEYCWLIYSDQSLPVADKLESDLQAEGKKVKRTHIGDVFDPVIFQREVESIYSNLPEHYQESDIILDFTGMTACASVGSVLACLNENRAIQYTPAQYDAKLKAVQPLNPVEVVLHWGLLRLPSRNAADATSQSTTLAVSKK